MAVEGSPGRKKQRRSNCCVANYRPNWGGWSPKPAMKLKDDAIIEALVELRFAPDELPELVVARLSDSPDWVRFKKKRLPAADIPQPLRQADPVLIHQPLLELIEPQGESRVRIGPAMMSFHWHVRYRGWEDFGPRLDALADHFFKVLRGTPITRVGLRYVNALTAKRHRIATIDDLWLKVEVGENRIHAPLNVNFITAVDETHSVTTRVASPEFIKNSTVPDATAFVDVDVFTPPGFAATDAKAVSAWLAKAHVVKNDAFFALIPPPILKELLAQ